MWTNKLDKKLIIAIILFAIILPLFINTNGAEASVSKQALEDHARRYGYSADTNNLTLTLDSTLSGYATAADARNKTNAKTSYHAGTYYVYNITDGAINVSRTTEAPGSWLNVNDLPKLQVSDNSTVTLGHSVKIYVTANDALKGQSAVGTYGPGSYNVYKTSGNAVNISRVANVPGAWIDSRELNDSNSTINQTTTRVSVPVVSGNQVKLSSSTSIYINADDAMNGRNSVGTYPAGDYHIYTRSGNAINISRSTNVPGAWIAESQVQATENPADKPSDISSNSPVNNKVEATLSNNKVTLSTSARTYVTAEDALNGSNQVGNYPQGTYHIYTRLGNALNISRVANAPGAWVHVDAQAGLSNNTQASPKPVTSTNHVSISGETVSLTSVTRIYLNAENAEKLTGSIGTYPVGTYYLYKMTDGALNISKAKGIPGAWINTNGADTSTAKPTSGVIFDEPVQQEVPVQPGPKTPAESPKVNTNSFSVVDGKLHLPFEVGMYSTAQEALSNTNRVGTFRPGDYYVFNTTKNAVNITRVQGVPGGWISATVAPIQSDIIEQLEEETPIKDQNNQDTGFVLVLDPGHGGGASSNRGGLLFNEGDQNYKFSLEIQKEANKYQDVTTRLTKQSINEDPSLRERAEAGAGADLYLSIHTNAVSNPNVRGVEMYGSKDNDSQAFADDLTNEISKTLDTPNRGVRYRDYDTGSITRNKSDVNKDYYAVLRDNPAGEKYIVETVFHSNLEDSIAYLENQETLAQKFMSTIARHFNLRLR